MEKIFGYFRKNDRPSSERYKYFADQYERHDIYEFIKELTEYIHSNNIESVILVDRSARPAWVGIDEYWKTNFPEEESPSIYFINPESVEIDSFFKRQNVSSRELRKDISIVKETGKSPLLEKFNEEVVLKAKDFIEKYKISKEKPVLIFDTCSHTGETLRAVVNLLVAAGYETRVLTANEADNMRTDKRLDGNTRLTSCYPFGKDSGVEKGDDLTSNLDENADREDVVRSRSEIRRIIKNRGA